jgi:hypothetical protein
VTAASPPVGKRPRRPSVRPVALAVAAILGLGVVAAAAFLRRPSAEFERVRDAPAIARETGGFTVAMVMTLVPKDGGPSRSTSATSALDERRQRAHIVLPAVLDPNGAELEVVSQGAVLYLLIPADRRSALGDKRWVRVNAGTPAAAQGAAVPPIPDPLSLLASLEGVVGGVARVGAETPGGVHTTRYRATVDLRTMAKRIGPERVALYNALARLNRSRLPVEVWVDERGRPRRLQIEADLGASGRIVADLAIGNFGRPPMIGIPPEDAVVDAADVAEALRTVGVNG